MSPAEKKTLVRHDHRDLSVSRQCRLLTLSRSSLYYTPVGISAEALDLMKAIDKVFTACTFFGSRQIAAYLRRDNVIVGRHRVRRLMAKMDLEAIYSTEIADGFHARRMICDWITFYNEKRPHTALGRRTPDEAYEGRETEKLGA